MGKRTHDFDLAAMEEALHRCDVNIATFEAAIEKEQATKREYRRIIEDLKFKRDHPTPQAVEIAVVRDPETRAPVDVILKTVPVDHEDD